MTRICRPQRLDVAGNAGDESSTPDRDEDRRDIAELVAQNLVGDRALAGDDQRIVERMHEHQPGFAHDLIAVCLGFGVAVAGQDHFGAERPHRRHLDVGRRLRHDDERAQAEMAGRIGDALCVVAGARRDNAARALGLGEMGDPVVGAPELVAEDWLEIFALEQDLILQALREVEGRLERRFLGDVVDTAVENQPQHRVGGRVRSCVSFQIDDPCYPCCPWLDTHVVRVVRG